MQDSCSTTRLYPSSLHKYGGQNRGTVATFVKCQRRCRFGETALSNIILYPSIVRSGNTFYGVGLPLLGSGVCSLLIWSELLEFMMHSDHSPAHSTSEQMHGPVCKTKNVVQWKKSVLKVTVFFFCFFFLQTRLILYSLELRNEYNSTLILHWFCLRGFPHLWVFPQLVS